MRGLKLWCIEWDQIGGDEYKELVVANNLKPAQAIAYIKSFVFKKEGFKLDDIDIEYLNYYLIENAPSVNFYKDKKKYKLEIKKRRFNEFFQWFNIAR